LYRDAARLYKNAAASGNFIAVLYFSRPPAWLRADSRPARWVAAHAPLDNPYYVASLLGSLREAGAHEQAAALLARDPAAQAALDDPGAVASLLGSLREAGAHEQAAALACRLPGAGLFKLFLKHRGSADQFRFGREADGTPAAPWGWEDLDLPYGLFLNTVPRCRN
jgi:hypothetical protein